MKSSQKRGRVAAASSTWCSIGCLAKDVVHLIATRATTTQKIQKTDEFTDAVQGEGVDVPSVTQRQSQRKSKDQRCSS